MKNDGSIHVLGNGRLCVYGQGADLIQVFGPPYSSPAFYRFELDTPASFSLHSEREPGAAVWGHRLDQDGRAVAEIQDFVDAELPCLVRSVRTSTPLAFRLDVQPPVQTLPNHLQAAQAGADGGILLEAPAGIFIYHVYPFPRPIVHLIAWRGPVEAIPGEDHRSFELVCRPGESVFYFASGEAYPGAKECLQAALGEPPQILLERTRRSWGAFAQRRPDFGGLLSPELPHRQAMLAAIDNVAVLIKVQQSTEGAVMAGHNYHLGYVRDQYGVARGLLALGYIEEARRILEFYWQVWQRHGRIHNAQAAGVEGVFHVHENDAAEITGYLILQAFDLYEKTGDEDFLSTIFPMLAWAFEAQKSELVEGMLPFNGDETYIAGGILPRCAIQDGSAEATLLFIDGGQKLLAWAERRRLWKGELLAGNRLEVETARSLYRKNFWQDGRLLTNNPRRAALASPAKFRHGVCERCSEEGLARGIEWTERTAAGRYLCPRCLARGPYPPATPALYELLSVSLTPFYFHSGLLSAEELRPNVESILRLYQSTGRLPSRPDDPRGATVGYDYGLLLYALAELRHPAVSQLSEKTLSLLDSAGAWVEYYIDHRPSGTRCRPWESAINIESLLYWFLDKIDG